MTKPTTADNLVDRQGEIDDIKKLVEQLTDALTCAETCETSTDFDANIEGAFDSIKEITAALKELRE